MEERLPPALRRPVRVVRRTIGNYFDEEGLQWSGAVAFYLVLSMPPLLIAAVSIGVVVVGPETARSFLVEQVTRLLPAERGIVSDIVQQTINSSGAAAIAALGFLLFSGSRVFASLIAAINIMWQEVEPSGFWRRQAQRIGMVLTAGVLLALAGLLDIGLAIATDALDLPVGVSILAQSQVVPTLFLGSALFLLFFLVPRRAASWQAALVGAVVGAIALRLAQWIFTGYLRAFGGFDSAYGPVAGLAAVLSWALVASSIILLAAHLVSVIHSPDREPTPRDEHDLPGQAEAKRRPRPEKRDAGENPSGR